MPAFSAKFDKKVRTIGSPRDDRKRRQTVVLLPFLPGWRELAAALRVEKESDTGIVDLSKEY